VAVRKTERRWHYKAWIFLHRRADQGVETGSKLAFFWFCDSKVMEEKSTLPDQGTVRGNQYFN
jgi:hypothetical protein